MRFDTTAAAHDAIRRLVVGGVALSLGSTALAAAVGPGLAWDRSPFVLVLTLLSTLGGLMLAVGLIAWAVSLGVRASGLVTDPTRDRLVADLDPLDPLD